MKSYLYLGDTHGDLDFVERAARVAAEYDAEIIQVGDWGMVWPHRNTKTWDVEDRTSHQLAALSTVLSQAGEVHAKPPVVMRFIDGNHDWHPKLAEYVEMNSMACATLPGGGVQIAPSVIYQPRGSTHEDEDGTRFLFVGGAPSIDRVHRTKGFSWWPEEVISEQDFRSAMNADYPIHVLVTHDAPDYPPGYEPKGDLRHRTESADAMWKLRRLGDRFAPALHVHGHWHTRATTHRGTTRVEALHCNHSRYFNDAVMLWSRDE